VPAPVGASPMSFSETAPRDGKFVILEDDAMLGQRSNMEHPVRRLPTRLDDRQYQQAKPR
jgi:hypothetical protein